MHPPLQHFFALAFIAATYMLFYKLTNFLASKISDTLWLFNAVLLFIFGSSTYKYFMKVHNLYFLLLSLLSFLFVAFFVYRGLQVPRSTPSINVNLSKQETNYILKILENERIAIQTTKGKPLIAEKYKPISSALSHLIIKIKNLDATSAPPIEISCDLLETSIIISTLHNALIASCQDDESSFDEEEENLRSNLSNYLIVMACREFESDNIDYFDLYQRD